MNQNYMNTLSGYSRCECHDCTQARWKMSFQSQLEPMKGLGGYQKNALTAEEAQKAAQQQWTEHNQ